jgi:hypothetical protein
LPNSTLELKIGKNVAISLGALAAPIYSGAPSFKQPRIDAWSEAPFFEYNANTQTLMFLRIREEWQNLSYPVYVILSEG